MRTEKRVPFPIQSEALRRSTLTAIRDLEARLTVAYPLIAHPTAAQIVKQAISELAAIRDVIRD